MIRPLTALLCAAFAAGTAAAQTSHEILRGRVATDSGRPVANANVTTTRAPDRVFKTTKSATDGTWTIDWPDGTGDYLVHVAASGFETARKRVTRSGADSVVVVDVVLKRAAVQSLAVVVVEAQRPRPDRNAIQGSDIGASETSTSSGPRSIMGDRLPPNLAGDLGGAASLVPGVASTPGGMSILGLGPAQNSVTLNGMAFNGGQVPRDVASIVRVSTSIYDPASGWFSGGRTNVQLAPGGLFTTRIARLTSDAPALELNDPLSSRLGQRVTSVRASAAGTGQLIEDRVAYNYGVEASRRSAPVASIASADPWLLATAGIAPDSAAHFIQLVGDARVPLAGGGAAATTDNVTLLARVDHAPFDWKTLTAAKTTWGLTAYADLARSGAQGLDVAATAGHAGHGSTDITALQASYSTYFGHDYLADVRSGISLTRDAVRPYLMVPEGRVLLSPNVLRYGGNGGMNQTNRQWTWESVADVQFYPNATSRHRLRVTADSRLDGQTQDVATNLQGTFNYNSIADLGANRAASFTRTLTAPARRSGEWNGFLAAGDVWRVMPTLQVLYGARIDGNVFTKGALYNPAVESAFGVRTDAAPNTVGVSPRFSFDWNLPRLFGSRGAIIRGGTGVFRNLVSPVLLAGPSAFTGLSGGTTRIACIGEAVPSPNWPSYVADPATIPRACAGGSPPTLVDPAPDVQLVNASYTPQSSWRSNLSWTSRMGRLPVTIEGVYSMNRHQPGMVDLNFDGVSKLAVGTERRPVFVSPDYIVPGSGIVSPAGARRSATFGRVSEAVSDLRSVSRQATISTTLPLWRLPTRSIIAGWRVAYTLSSIRAQQRGFDGSTFDDPTTKEWARGTFDVRHQVVTSFTALPFDYVRGLGVVVAARFQSGLPYTPMIRTDVNGDGLANDRAFVADTLMSRCLARQSGRVAGRNSCEGPWTTALNLTIIVGRESVPFLPKRMEVAFSVVNVAGGVDRLLHGSNDLRGWGAMAAPDPVLYSVTGYDRASNRFLYAVNPRFGSANLANGLARAPLRVTLDVSVDIAPERTAQQLDRWLRPGRAGREGPRVSAADLARRLQRNVPDPYADLLQQSDSLLLTTDQLRALQDARTDYRARIDAIWDALARSLADVPDRYDAGSAFTHADRVVDDAWELTRTDVQRRLSTILTPIQLSLLGGWPGRFYNAAGRMHDRVFIP